MQFLPSGGDVRDKCSRKQLHAQMSAATALDFGEMLSSAYRLGSRPTIDFPIQPFASRVPLVFNPRAVPTSSSNRLDKALKMF
jgi:hypothetical protein